ncbi:MAG: hypothetical protein F4Y86_03265 [Gammaproteobacteria bacterium]|nr:hypothetical protein [Gammaproteobacteria bacterium]
MTNKLDLAVIESRWWVDGNHSVRPIFDMLAGVIAGNPYSYHYEMFNNAESIKEIVRRLADQRDTRHLYIAAHGNEDFICGPREQISRAVLRNLIADVRPRQLHGVFFGCCLFGKQVEALAERAKVTWLAGYTERVDWVHSSAMDLYFWHAFYQSGASRATRAPDRVTQMLLLLWALLIRVPYMFVELGFRVTLSSDNTSYSTFPDDYIDGSEPKDEYLALHNLVVDFIKTNDPGTWPNTLPD